MKIIKGIGTPKYKSLGKAIFRELVGKLGWTFKRLMLFFHIKSFLSTRHSCFQQFSPGIGVWSGHKKEGTTCVGLKGGQHIAGRIS